MLIDTEVRAVVVIGRPRGFDREAVLDAAMQVFWRKGYAAASMNDLCGAMGIRSPSLYAAFGSKEALYLEAINHYVMTVGPPVWDSLTGGATARDGVESLLLASTKTLPCSASTPGGCMALLGGVVDEWPTVVADVVKSVRGELLGLLRSRLGAGAARGELSAARVDGLSRFYLAVIQGMAVQARDGAPATELRGIAEAAMNAWPRGAGKESRRPDK